MTMPAMCEMRDQCALYLLGLLDDEAAALYERHLAEECDVCSAELVALGGALELIARADAAVPPDPGVKERILARVHEERRDSNGKAGVQIWKQWRPDSVAKGFFTLRAHEGEWEPIDIEGIRIKRLAADPASKTVTMLVRMDASTEYPGHRHAGVEECYVLEGDLYVGDDIVLHAGDYQRADRQSVHPRQWTEGGCLLFIVSSTEDEILE
jgi:anti-sigma factor ChrR (cupin superfamily)